eukprot:2872881-Ditylum_brightwellii.AAC.1
MLPPRPKSDGKEWDIPSPSSQPDSNSSSLFCVLRAVVEGAFVHLLNFVQPLHEVALKEQIPRFEVALDKLSELVVSS